MADVANTPNTGPASKGTHSGGKTFTPKLSHRGESWGSFSNACSAGKSSIMKLKYKAGNFGGDPSSALKRKPSSEE